MVRIPPATSCTCARPRSSARRNSASVRGSDVASPSTACITARSASSVEQGAAEPCGGDDERELVIALQQRPQCTVGLRQLEGSEARDAASAGRERLGRVRVQALSHGATGILETRMHAQNHARRLDRRLGWPVAEVPAANPIALPAGRWAAAPGAQAAADRRAAGPGPDPPPTRCRRARGRRCAVEPRRSGTASEHCGVDGDAGGPRHELGEPCVQ